MIASVHGLLVQLASATSAAEAGSQISLSAAVVGIAAIGVLVMTKMLLELRDRVSELESRAERSSGTNAPAVRPRSAAPLPSPLPATGAIAPEIVAVIAAAVHVSPGHDYRIVSLQPMPETRVWSLEGRRQVFHSHQVR